MCINIQTFTHDICTAESNAHHTQQEEGVPACPADKGRPEHNVIAPAAGTHEHIHVGDDKKRQVQDLRARLDEQHDRALIAPNGPQPPLPALVQTPCSPQEVWKGLAMHTANANTMP